MNLRVSDCTLPKTGWGVLLLSESSPRVGSAWTDDGKPYEERGLKRRARSATRDVPIARLVTSSAEPQSHEPLPSRGVPTEPCNDWLPSPTSVWSYGSEGF